MSEQWKYVDATERVVSRVLDNGRSESCLATALPTEDEDGEPIVYDILAADPPIKPTYEELRRAEYPPVGDQLDAIWKQLNQDRLDGKDLIQEAEDLLGAVLAVKDKYPKLEN